MITEKTKSTRIMKEILNYFLDQHIYQFDLHFNITPEFFELSLNTEVEQEPAFFQSFLNDLNVPREVEEDEYYNALLGCHNKHAEVSSYTSLGKAIDIADGKFENGKLTLQIIRYNTH